MDELDEPSDHLVTTIVTKAQVCTAVRGRCAGKVSAQPRMPLHCHLELIIKLYCIYCIPWESSSSLLSSMDNFPSPLGSVCASVRTYAPYLVECPIYFWKWCADSTSSSSSWCAPRPRVCLPVTPRALDAHGARIDAKSYFSGQLSSYHLPL